MTDPSDLPSPQMLETFLLRAAQTCARETLPFFRQGADQHEDGIINKLADTQVSAFGATFDPVTQADKNAETALREMIRNEFPHHGIIGEEFGTENETASAQWILDPIDGTRAFITGLPGWGCLIGLTVDAKAVAGLMHQPFTGESYVNAGAGTFLHHAGTQTSLSTRKTRQLRDAYLMTTAPELFTEDGQRAFQAVSAGVKMTRYGYDCYAYAMLAAGNIDLVIESGLNAYDIAALVPLIEGAGGVVSTWNGETAVHGGDIIAAANPALHEQALTLLNG